MNIVSSNRCSTRWYPLLTSRITRMYQEMMMMMMTGSVVNFERVVVSWTAMAMMMMRMCRWKRWRMIGGAAVVVVMVRSDDQKEYHVNELWWCTIASPLDDDDNIVASLPAPILRSSRTTTCSFLSFVVYYG